MAKPPPFKPTVVHAFRRLPHMQDDGRGNMVEQAVLVEIPHEGKTLRAKFKSNEEGHVVATIDHEVLFKRLVEGIPEAYIPYQGGDNVPAIPAAGDGDKPAKRPDGAFVLQSSDGTFMVLDDMADADLRTFAKDADIEAEALPEALTGDTLRRAIFNLLGGAQ